MFKYATAHCEALRKRRSRNSIHLRSRAFEVIFFCENCWMSSALFARRAFPDAAPASSFGQMKACVGYETHAAARFKLFAAEIFNQLRVMAIAQIRPAIDPPMWNCGYRKSFPGAAIDRPRPITSRNTPLHCATGSRGHTGDFRHALPGETHEPVSQSPLRAQRRKVDALAVRRRRDMTIVRREVAALTLAGAQKSAAARS
jgi:hypothetical protein